MKSTGIVRRIDDLGRIVIPKELRKEYGIEKYTQMEIYVDDEYIVIKKYNSKRMCKNCEKIIENQDKYCKYCGEEMK